MNSRVKKLSDFFFPVTFRVLGAKAVVPTGSMQQNTRADGFLYLHIPAANTKMQRSGGRKIARSEGSRLLELRDTD